MGLVIFSRRPATDRYSLGTLKHYLLTQMFKYKNRLWILFLSSRNAIWIMAGQIYQSLRRFITVGGAPEYEYHDQMNAIEYTVCFFSLIRIVLHITSPYSRPCLAEEQCQPHSSRHPDAWNVAGYLRAPYFAPAFPQISFVPRFRFSNRRTKLARVWRMFSGCRYDNTRQVL